jgi:hypothetical protein
MLSEDIRNMAGVRLNGDVWEFAEVDNHYISKEASTSNTDIGSASYKNKKKRDQKKKKQQELSKLSANNKVTFGTVEEILFSREISYDAIPSRYELL